MRKLGIIMSLLALLLIQHRTLAFLQPKVCGVTRTANNPRLLHPSPTYIDNFSLTAHQCSAANSRLGTRLDCLPACTSNEIVKVAVISGTAALSSQLLLTRYFQRSKDPVRKSNAAYTAHSIVALGLMVLVSAIGIKGFYFDPRFDTAYDRILTSSNPAQLLAAVIFGSFFAWDIGISLKVKQLRKLDVVIHHFCMVLLAALGATVLPTQYILFYFGVSELSSIPLVIYDQLAVDCEELDVESSRYAKLSRARDISQVIAAAFFIAVRVWSFTKVTMREFLPDCLTILRGDNNNLTAGTIRMIRGVMVASVAFTALQLGWFAQIVKYALGGDDKQEE